MSRRVKVNPGHRNVLLPNGFAYHGPHEVTLTDGEFRKVNPSAFSSGLLEDLGPAKEAEGHTDHTYFDPTHRSAILPTPVLVSPNGSRFRLRVANDGTLSTVLVAYAPEAAGNSGTGYMSESGERLISSTAYAFKGDPITPEESFVVTALHGDIEVVAGGTYQGIILVGDQQVEAILARSEPVAAVTTGLTHMVFPMNVELGAGVEVVVLVGRIDAGDGHALPVDSYDGARSGFTWQAIPAGDVGTSCSRIVSADPQVGDPINRGKGYNSAPFNVHIDWVQPT